jgi:t-SNARE complex subunit (syntaxin)
MKNINTLCFEWVFMHKIKNSCQNISFYQNWIEKLHNQQITLLIKELNLVYKY